MASQRRAKKVVKRAERKMPAKRRARAPSQTKAGRTDLLLEELRSDVKRSIDATLMLREEMIARFESSERRTEARFDILENVVRSSSADIQTLAAQTSKNTEAITKLSVRVDKNTEGTRKNTEAIATLSVRVDKNTDGTRKNTEAIAKLSARVDENTEGTRKNTEAITKLSVRVDKNTEGTRKNTEAIAKLSVRVDENTEGVRKNTEAIEDLRTTVATKGEVEALEGRVARLEAESETPEHA